MPYDVFVSYSAKDKSTADRIVAGLERDGIRCWVAPRDIRPGLEWGGAIMHAIGICPIMLVVFSKSSNTSKQVLREVERAVHKEKTLVPFRIEETEPTESMEFFLSTNQWQDALDGQLDAHIAKLAETLRGIVRPQTQAMTASPPDAGALRLCPFCAEEIRVAAKVCKHCGRDVDPVFASPSTSQTVVPLRDVAEEMAIAQAEEHDREMDASESALTETADVDELPGFGAYTIDSTEPNVQAEYEPHDGPERVDVAEDVEPKTLVDNAHALPTAGSRRRDPSLGERLSEAAWRFLPGAVAGLLLAWTILSLNGASGYITDTRLAEIFKLSGVGLVGGYGIAALVPRRAARQDSGLASIFAGCVSGLASAGILSARDFLDFAAAGDFNRAVAVPFGLGLAASAVLRVIESRDSRTSQHRNS